MPDTYKAVELEVDKITCQSCVNFIENNLSGIDGIQKVRANLTTSSVNLEFDPKKLALKDIHHKLNDVNYKVKTSSLVLKIDGMTCASCVSKIEKALSGLEGVVSAHINLADQKARITFIPSVISEDAFASVIDKLGYAVVSQPGITSEESSESSYSDKVIRNFKIALPLTAIIFFISHLGMFGISPLSQKLTFVILLILTIPVQFYCGRQFYIGFWKSLKNFTATMDTLVAVGTSAAFIYSLVATFYPSLLSSTGQNVAIYYDTAAIIITLILLGRILENRARKATILEIEKLTRLESSSALIERDQQEIKIEIAQIKIDDIVIIKPGSALPVDGIVVAGNSAVDESMLTGEPLPHEIQIGDRVLAGSMNKTGSFKYRAEAVGSDTVLSKISESVKQIISSRAPIQRLADKVAAVFVPAVMIIAIIALIAWLFLPAQTDITFALLIFIAVLIIACPCALGLATPTAIMMGSSRGAREGILIKSATVLEQVEKIDTVVFDKTGTLSVGRPEVERLISFGTIDQKHLLSLAGSLEQASEHPLASAVLSFAKNNQAQISGVKEFEYFPGLGLRGKVSGDYVQLGNLAFLTKEKVDLNSVGSSEQTLHSAGFTVLYLAVNYTLEAKLLISDPVKEEAFEVIAKLKQSGQEVWLLSGDNKSSAEKTGSLLGIENILAEVLPHEKAEHIKSLKASGKKVAMIGDGVNDAPALAQADIGIALGSGTDVAVSIADITLIGSNLLGVNKALRLSEKTLLTIKQNLGWAFGYNIIAIPLAAGVLYPSLGLLLSPIIASMTMAFSSIFVITNSLRLRRLKL